MSEGTFSDFVGDLYFGAVSGPKMRFRGSRTTVDFRYLEHAYLELLFISKWKSDPCLNIKI